MLLLKRISSLCVKNQLSINLKIVIVIYLAQIQGYIYRVASENEITSNNLKHQLVNLIFWLFKN